ncbi:hypothetical protein WJ96_04990 [Burkholderia ubonensis]|uniref:Transposase n=1 Tax=Burkholderia ubonensis TaxID=101571 RepID=A0AAW3MSN3_9BURK|nr:hypothetical protein WJ96_04990 [Burkholderia ubonensis]KVZ92626.1 hypothetical protein WL25_16645 [Burkholderia ubonensis]
MVKPVGRKAHCLFDASGQFIAEQHCAAADIAPEGQAAAKDVTPQRHLHTAARILKQLLERFGACEGHLLGNRAARSRRATLVGFRCCSARGCGMSLLGGRGGFRSRLRCGSRCSGRLAYGRTTQLAARGQYAARQLGATSRRMGHWLCACRHASGLELRCGRVKCGLRGFGAFGLALAGCCHDGLLGRIKWGSHRLHRRFCYWCRRRADESLTRRVLQIFFVFRQLALVGVGGQLPDALNHGIREVWLSLFEPAIREASLHQAGIDVAKPAIVELQATFCHVGNAGYHHLEGVSEQSGASVEGQSQAAEI